MVILITGCGDCTWMILVNFVTALAFRCVLMLSCDLRILSLHPPPYCMVSVPEWLKSLSIGPTGEPNAIVFCTAWVNFQFRLIPFFESFSSTLSFLESYMTRGAFLDRSPDNFSSMKSCHEKLFCVCWVYIQDESFNYFENDKIKVQVNETKLTGLWARKCANIQQVLISKFPFDPELPVTAHTDPCLFYSLWCHLSVRKFCFLCMPELPKLIFYILIRWSWSLWHVNDFLVRFSSL